MGEEIRCPKCGLLGHKSCAITKNTIYYDCESEYDDQDGFGQSKNCMIVERDLQIKQLRTQLAGCLVASEGATNPEQIAKQEDYGWSPAYQSVLELRKKYDEMRKS